MNKFPDTPSNLPEERGEDSFRRIKDGMPYGFITNENFPIVLERENIAEDYPHYVNWEPPFTPETNEQNTYKLLRKMVMKPGRTWTIRI